MSKTIYIDVREPEEYAASHVAGALNVPVGIINNNNDTLSQINKEDQIVVYCRSGARAEQAKQKLVFLGFNNVENGINQEKIARLN